MSETYSERSYLAALANPEAALRELDRLDAEERLIDFMRLMWHVTDPATPFVPGWPIEAICDHLEAVTAGEIRRLLINVPPGFSKSTAVDVMWPAWEWGPRGLPAMRYVAASYSQGLTIRDNQRFLRVVTSNLYRELWGNRFLVDRVGEIKIQNDRTGWKFATSVGGIGTGERGNRILADDPNSVMEVESDAVRGKANMWFREVVPDRLNDQQRDAIIVIQQRTHEDDVSGTALAHDLGYEHLCIPMEFDGARKCYTSIGWEDPRTEDGELAWEDRFPPQIVEELKREKGPYAYAGQYQQSPAPRGGGIVKREWWQVWPKQEAGDKALWFPPMEFILASLDTAMTTRQDSDYSALTIWGAWRDENDLPKLMLMDAWAAKLEFHALVERVIASCRKRKVDRLLVEAKNNGFSVAQEILRLCHDQEWGTEPNKVEGDKVARVYSIQHLFSGGLVYAPDRKWADDVIAQFEVFPKGRHDDLVDSCSAALQYLRRIGLAVLREEREIDLTRRLTFSSPARRRLPYDV